MKIRKILPVLALAAVLVSCNRGSTSISSTNSGTSTTTTTTTTTTTPTPTTTTTPSTPTSTITTTTPTPTTPITPSVTTPIPSTPTPTPVPTTPIPTTPAGEKYESSQSLYQSIKSNGDGAPSLPSIGEPNILVVPVDFSDYSFSRQGDTNEEAKARINDAFFGEREDTELVESLASYYEQSSYGKLKIKGTVTDVITAPRTHSYYGYLGNESAQIVAIDELITNILNTLGRTYDLSDYDTDGDGYFDAIWIVYSAPYNYNNIYWAFTYWSNINTSFDGIYPGAYCWASYSFLDEGGYTSHPDAHTLIHETGHLLGLDDYYDYSDEPVYPTGGLDMMDYNIGDHMAFSKYNLGWINPDVITESGTYTLDAFPSSGESYIIPAPNYNNSPFWEYYIVEYYTPTGLNQLDAFNRYGNYPPMFTDSGLRVYRVNQKLGYLNARYTAITGEIIEDINSIRQGEPYVVINSNTPDFSYSLSSTKPKLVRLVSSDPTYTMLRYASNDDLFKLNDTYSSSNITWQDNSRLNFSFNITAISDNQLTFTFTFAE